MNGNPAETPSTEVGSPPEQRKPDKKPRGAAQKAHVAPSGAKSGKKPRVAKKAPRGAMSAKSPKKKVVGAREGSKAAKVLNLLRRSSGATLKELTKATGWQAHSVRGFMSGAIGKRMGLTVASTKAENKERRYSVRG
jgi:hypothetical protein